MQARRREELPPSQFSRAIQAADVQPVVPLFRNFTQKTDFIFRLFIVVERSHAALPGRARTHLAL